jgi:hypothetical protein
MRCLVLNCTLKPSPEASNTEALAEEVVRALRQRDVEVEVERVLDHDVRPGVSSDEGNGDQWPEGPGPGPSYTETDHRHDWSAKTGRAMASNLVAVATALQRWPVPPPPD